MALYVSDWIHLSSAKTLLRWMSKTVAKELGLNYCECTLGYDCRAFRNFVRENIAKCSNETVVKIYDCFKYHVQPELNSSDHFTALPCVYYETGSSLSFGTLLVLFYLIFCTTSFFLFTETRKLDQAMTKMLRRSSKKISGVETQQPDESETLNPKRKRID